MFLRSLVMKGFKSFADTTALEFEPGMTVVVGPNGSGKSNVVDAVAWVLGAQGPRTLRSQKMEDVIFAGTASRAALGRAEVSLTIDNTSGKLPTELAEVTVTRTLFRSGESEYAINATPCRLLDVQELLSDSGVGRQQHMIIGQGQLDSVLSARPEDRRSVIEEAAGVLKHRRRRERAQRRLAATEENLDRLGDLVREVRRQIRPLERQAAAARSHALVRDELRVLRLHVAGVELTSLVERHDRAHEERSVVAAEERRLQAELAALDAEAGRATAELSRAPENDLAAVVAKVEGLLGRGRGLGGVLQERRRSLEASLEAAADVDVVATLEADAARLSEQMAENEAQLQALEAELAEALEEERRLGAVEDELRGRLEGLEGEGRGSASEALRRAEERRGLLGRHLEAARRSRDSAQGRVSAAEGRLAELEAARHRHLEARELAGGDLQAAAGSLREAEAAEEEARRAAEGAEERARTAARVRHGAEARAEALARALEDLHDQPGRRALTDLEGALGSLADLVVVTPPYEQAFLAAVAGFEGAVLVEGVPVAGAALERLHRQGLSGAVVAAGDGEGPTSSAERPADTEPLRRFVRPRSEPDHASVGAALDRLLGPVVVAASWPVAFEAAAARPDLVVVTSDGDRFAGGTFKVRTGAKAVTAAAVEEARRAAEEATSAAEAAEEARRGALARARTAAEALAERRRHHDRLESARSALEVERRQLEGAMELAGGDHEGALAELDEKAGEEQALAKEMSELEASLPDLEAATEEARQRDEEARGGLELATEGHRRATERKKAAELRQAELAERLRVLGERRASVERRLAGHVEERQQAAARRQRLQGDLVAVSRLGQLLDGAEERLEGIAGRLQTAYRSQAEAARARGQRLDALHRERARAEQSLQGLRQRASQLEVALAELTMAAGQVTDVIHHELDSEPEAALATPCPELPPGVSADHHVEYLTQRLAELGPINPLALDELGVLEERSAELDREVQDVRTARRELQHVVRYLDEEIATTFAQAVADVNEHFSALAATLFPGGTGRLALTEPEDPLETGVEIEVRPAGRNVKRISLLSGGERSLVAIAFLFAVFKSRPSPFYLMDEVEAALDDVNLHRFLDLVGEFRREAQLIVISHQKRTMETADALYGVTMAPGGSSQVISQRVERDHPAEGRQEAPFEEAAPLGG